MGKFWNGEILSFKKKKKKNHDSQMVEVSFIIYTYIKVLMYYTLGHQSRRKNK